MKFLPAALIVVNKNISDSVIESLTRQLFIDTVMTGEEFDSMSVTLDYDAIVDHNRVMVVRDFSNRADVPNWNMADVVIFVTNGLASIEKNKFGPPGLTFKVATLTWSQLGMI